MRKNMEKLSQDQRLTDLVEAFKEDSGEYRYLKTPADAEGRKRLLRSLMNIRMPRPLPEAVLRTQDEYLRARAGEKGIVTLADIPAAKGLLSIWQGDITRLAVDAIVNAANSQMFQSVDPRKHKTYDNEAWVMQAMAAQGFAKDANGIFQPTDSIIMQIPTSLIPKDPDGGEVTMNLRADDSFVEDEGWHHASAAYASFLEQHDGKHVLFLELGVGANTPVIIKYPFWTMTAENSTAVYACLNFNEAICPEQIVKQSICVDGDTGDVIEQLLSIMPDTP